MKEKIYKKKVIHKLKKIKIKKQKGRNKKLKDIKNIKSENNIKITRAVNVIDGDTFTTRESQTIRLIGINAPEIGEPGAKKALQILEQMIVDHPIFLDICPVRRVDKYFRFRAMVYTSGFCINRALWYLGVVDIMDKRPCHITSEMIKKMQRTEIKNLANFFAEEREKYKKIEYMRADRIGDIKTGVFHLPACHLTPGRPRQIYFKSEECARGWGYEPCPVCGE